MTGLLEPKFTLKKRMTLRGNQKFVRSSSAPGPRIFASATEENFELAIRKTVFELEQQLKKRKAVFVAH